MNQYNIQQLYLGSLKFQQLDMQMIVLQPVSYITNIFTSSSEDLHSQMEAKLKIKF